MKLNERLKLIRTTEGFTQVEFAKLIGVSCDADLRQIESGKRKNIGSDKIEKICLRFPEYALWLTTEQVQPPHQISPDLAKSNKDSNNASARAKVKL